jgi:nucleotide-binding universal stress UspA family protein
MILVIPKIVLYFNLCKIRKKQSSVKPASNMKTILVPHDFSPNADRALAAAKQIASKMGAALLIMYVYQPYAGEYLVPESIVTGPFYPELENEYRTKLQERASLAREQGYQADPIWETGNVETAVLRQAREKTANLIVLGRTGMGKVMDKFFGSAATGIALQAPCPVLIIPPGQEAIRFEQIVYATQLEFDEKDILSEITALADQLNGKLRLVKVNSDQQLNLQPDNQYIEEIVQEVGIDRDDITILDGDHVMKDLQNYCDRIKAGLLIVSNKRRNFLANLLNPSMTKKLTVDTHVPLLVYHRKSDEKSSTHP